MPKYCISDLITKINAPEWVLHDNLRIFLCNIESSEDSKTALGLGAAAQHEGADVCCSIVFKRYDTILVEKAMLVVKTMGTSIYNSEGYIYNLSGDKDDIPSCIVASEDWSVCTMYIDPEYNNPNDKVIIQCVREGVLVALRKIMIAALAQKQGLIIHSSSILWNNKGILFSAPAGTGKSTHVHLWKQLYDTPILDGDATACRLINGNHYVYGLPWCGTSGEFMNQSAPLGAIVFLQQAKENSIIKLEFHEAFLRLTARCFLLPWNDKMTNQFIDIIQEVAASADCYLLNCMPDQDAVDLVKNCLEGY